MEEGTKVTEFLTEVQIFVNSLCDIEERPSDVMVIEHALNALPPSFDNFVTNISGAQEMPTFDDLAGRIELWETRTKNKTKHTNEEALVVQFRKLFRHHRFQDNKYKRASSGNQTSRTKQGYCGTCGKWGHWAQDCSEQTPVPPTLSTTVH